MDRKKNYTDYKATDFLQDSYFLKWIRDKNPKAVIFWERWQKDHPEMEVEIKEAIQQFHLLTSFDPLKPKYGEQEEMWYDINREIDVQAALQRRKVRHIRIRRYVAVAAVALLLVGSWYLYNVQSKKDNLIVVLANNKTKKVVLPDNSVIVLNKNAVLKYHQDNPRELWLTGEAFFDVKHRSASQVAANPFIVHAGIEKIAVLGTVFMVKTIEDAARVVLLRGKVKTSIDDQAVVMNPDEKVEWENGKFSVEKVNAGLYAAWKTGEFQFDNTSLQELKEVLKEVYGYKLIFRDTGSLKTKTISGTVSTKDESVLWKTISFMFDVKVEKDKDKVILTAN